jgi:hypothetical protein
MKSTVIILVKIIFLSIVSNLKAQESDLDFKVKENKISKITQSFYNFSDDINKKELFYSFTSHYNEQGIIVKSTQKNHPNEYMVYLYDSLKRSIGNISYTNKIATDKIIYVYKNNVEDYYQVRKNSKGKWDTLTHQRDISENNLVKCKITFKSNDTTSIVEYEYVNGKDDIIRSYTYLLGEKNLQNTLRFYYKEGKLEKAETLNNREQLEGVTFYTYDSFGRNIEKKSYSNDVLMYECYYKYDKNGLLYEKVEKKSNSENVLTIYEIEKRL